MINDTLAILKQVSFLSEVDDSALLALAERATIKSFPNNTIILYEGDETGPLYVILSGRVRVFLCDDEGKEITLTHLGPGTYFGELALLDDQPRSASVMTLDKTTCGIISKNIFKEWLHAHPEAAFRLIQSLIQKIRQLTDNVRSLALSNVYERIVKVLNELAVERDDRLIIPEKLTQQELANRVGASREMVSKIMKELKKGDYIRTDDHQWIILKKLPASW